MNEIENKIVYNVFVLKKISVTRDSNFRCLFFSLSEACVKMKAIWIQNVRHTGLETKTKFNWMVWKITKKNRFQYL